MCRRKRGCVSASRVYAYTDLYGVKKECKNLAASLSNLTFASSTLTTLRLIKTTCHFVWPASPIKNIVKSEAKRKANPVNAFDVLASRHTFSHWLPRSLVSTCTNNAQASPFIMFSLLTHFLASTSMFSHVYYQQRPNLPVHYACLSMDFLAFTRMFPYVFSTCLIAVSCELFPNNIICVIMARRQPKVQVQNRACGRDITPSLTFIKHYGKPKFLAHECVSLVVKEDYWVHRATRKIYVYKGRTCQA